MITESQIDAAQSRNDYERNNSTPIYCRPITDQIAFHECRADAYDREIGKDNWRLGRDPEAIRAEYRALAAGHRATAAELRALVCVPMAAE